MAVGENRIKTLNFNDVKRKLSIISLKTYPDPALSEWGYFSGWNGKVML